MPRDVEYLMFGNWEQGWFPAGYYADPDWGRGATIRDSRFRNSPAYGAFSDVMQSQPELLGSQVIRLLRPAGEVFFPPQLSPLFRPS